MYTTYIESVCRHVSHISILRSTIALKRGFLSLKTIVQNRTMSKLSFRARALDANKSLPVYHADDVPDLPDIASVNRVVPQMPTGMEKEEETEHHLQRAITAQQIYGEAQRLIIPTPDTILSESDYIQLTKRQVVMPKQLIHVQAFTLEDELPDYDCDEEDSRWLLMHNKRNPKEVLTVVEFEQIIDTLEKGCSSKQEQDSSQLLTLKDAYTLLKREGKVVDACFEYWKQKRTIAAATLVPPVRAEKKDGSALHDPYVAFRRRVEKMQTRKNRKNDEASYEKMLALRRDLKRACLILEMVKLREEQKRNLLDTTIKVLETRYVLLNALTISVTSLAIPMSKIQVF
jgi:enhancer of polycomb-like protein